jgi:hypothetical protein
MGQFVKLGDLRRVDAHLAVLVLVSDRLLLHLIQIREGKGRPKHWCTLCGLGWSHREVP